MSFQNQLVLVDIFFSMLLKELAREDLLICIMGIRSIIQGCRYDKETNIFNGKIQANVPNPVVFTVVFSYFFQCNCFLLTVLRNNLSRNEEWFKPLCILEI